MSEASFDSILYATVYNTPSPTVKALRYGLRSKACNNLL